MTKESEVEIVNIIIQKFNDIIQFDKIEVKFELTGSIVHLAYANLAEVHRFALRLISYFRDEKSGRKEFEIDHEL